MRALVTAFVFALISGPASAQQAAAQAAPPDQHRCRYRQRLDHLVGAAPADH